MKVNTTQGVADRRRAKVVHPEGFRRSIHGGDRRGGGGAREEMELVCDRVIAGIAGRDVALPAVGLKPPRRRP
jgi:hypothetical protein